MVHPASNQHGAYAVAQQSAWSSIRRRLRRHMIPIIIAGVTLGVIFFITIGASLPDDGEPVPVSGDAAMSLAEKVQASIAAAGDTKTITIRVTEEEVTSLLSIASVLSDQIKDAGGTGNLDQIDILSGASAADIASWQNLIASQSGVGAMLTKGLDLGVTIKDPEVKFTSDGEIIVRGYGKMGPVSVPARAVVAPKVVNGNLEFDIVEGQLGRLPLPGSVSDLIGTGIEKALLAGNSVGSVSQFDIQDGSLTFTGSLK